MQFLAAAARFVPFISIGAWYFVKSLPQIFKLMFELGKLHEARKYQSIKTDMQTLTEQVKQLRSDHGTNDPAGAQSDKRNP